MTLKDRVYFFIESQKISKSEFERRCGLSNGYVNAMREGFGTKKLEQVLRAFPQLNREWLLFGEGEMTSDTPPVQTQQAGDNTRQQQALGNGITQTISEESETLSKALDEISEMRKALTEAMRINQEHTSRLLAIVEKILVK